MKILLLADINSIHTIKWANGLIEKGLEVGVWSIEGLNKDKAEMVNKAIKIYSAKGKQKRENLFSKISYLTFFFSAKKAVKNYKPDILHAHYATSFGLIGRLIGFKPYIISVWGSDVYLFPRKNRIFKEVLIKNLKSADLILSTSEAMGDETQKYINKKVLITPFGIDLDKFFVREKTDNRQGFIIGCIKSLEEIYGIKYLILAFKKFLDKYHINAVLKIGGSGSEEAMLKKLVNELNINEHVEFVGRINNDLVPLFLSQLDVAAFPSLSESFGVAALEASSVGIPVIASNVGGLPEVVINGKTGIIVEPRDVVGLFNAIEYLYNNPKECKRLGENGLIRVKENYEIKSNTQMMVDIYKTLLNNK